MQHIKLVNNLTKRKHIFIFNKKNIYSAQVFTLLFIYSTICYFSYFLQVSGLACIVLGALAHSEASDIDTDRIEPLMDTITMKAIQPLGVVKNLSIILILLGVFIVLITILAIVVILYGAVHSTKFVQVRVSIYQ